LGEKMEGEVMLYKGRRDFCTECRKETEYILQKRDVVKRIRDKDYLFEITAAVCSECGAQMSIPGLIDDNVHEIDEQYRTEEGLVQIDDIEKLMKIYKIGKAPLSLALGFGEVTIPRYLLIIYEPKTMTDEKNSVVNITMIHRKTPFLFSESPLRSFFSEVSPSSFFSRKDISLPISLMGCGRK